MSCSGEKKKHTNILLTFTVELLISTSRMSFVGGENFLENIQHEVSIAF